MQARGRALVAEYLDQLGRGKKPPVARDDDPRWEHLKKDGGRTAEFDEDDEIAGETNHATSGRARAGPRTRASWDEKIKQHVFAKGQEELAELVWSLTQRFGELRDEFRERILLGGGDVDRLVAEARKELHRVTAQEAWRSEGKKGDWHGFDGLGCPENRPKPANRPIDKTVTVPFVLLCPAVPFVLLVPASSRRPRPKFTRC